MIRPARILAALVLATQPLVAQEAKLTPLHPLLTAAPLPAGYEATTQGIKDGEKVLGDLILISKPDQVSKVIVRIENRDLRAIPARRAAVKGYVNGFATGMAEQGFKVVEKNIPDMAKLEFTRPVAVGLVFANDEGKKVWTHQEIFFTDQGFAVQVIADEPTARDSLTQWAKTIKPKPE